VGKSAHAVYFPDRFCLVDSTDVKDVQLVIKKHLQSVKNVTKINERKKVEKRDSVNNLLTQLHEARPNRRHLKLER